MKYLIFAFCFVFASSAFAADGGGLGGFAQSIVDYAEYFKYFITDGIPSFFERMAAWAVEMYVYLKFVMYLETIKFSWGVAKVILQDLSITQHLETMFSYLPSSLRAFAFDCRIVDAINVVLNAYVTRFVFRII